MMSAEPDATMFCGDVWKMESKLPRPGGLPMTAKRAEQGADHARLRRPRDSVAQAAGFPGTEAIAGPEAAGTAKAERQGE